MAAATIKPQDIMKSTQVQSATHLEILTVGNKVFEKETEEQKSLFEEERMKREKIIIMQLQNEHLESIKMLENQHKENIKHLKAHYLKIQNEAMKAEASRVEDIMNKNATELVKETVLDGQKKLDDALVVARDEFNLKKEEKIKLVIAEQRAIAMDMLKQKEVEHLKHIEKLNEECQVKLVKESENYSKDLETKLSEERSRLRKQFDVELQTALNNANDKHVEHVEQLNIETKIEENKKEDLKKEIERLENDLKEMNGHLKMVMASFQRFVDSSPGFYEGQSEFLLQDLLPITMGDVLSKT